MSRFKASQSLLALSAAAAAIPSPAQAWESGYRYSLYTEDDLPSDRSAAGRSMERYEIETHQLSLSGNPRADWALDIDLMIETMSGASPWFVVPNANNEPVQIMSGATIQDERYALYGKAWREQRGGSRVGLSLGVSDEDDYQALSAGLEGVWEFDQKRTSLSLGLGYSDDTLEPTEGGSQRFPDRIQEADKSTWSVSAGLSRVLSQTTLVQFALSGSYSEGYLSDPYKLVQIENEIRPDSRPEERTQYAGHLRIRQYLRPAFMALHMDYRRFGDDWGIASDTLEFGIWQKPAKIFRWHARFRWYRQSDADFYGPIFGVARSDGFSSSDYRLSAYEAQSYRLGFDLNMEGWQVGFAAEDYSTSADGGETSPGLVDFLIYSVSIGFGWGEG